MLMSYFGRILLVLMPILLLSASLVHAQEQEVPRISDAEELFQRAVAQFEEGQYEESKLLFERIYASFPLHQRTTASMAMHAKAAFRAGAYEEADAVAAELLDSYGHSRYAADMQQLRSLVADHQGAEAADPDPVRLGIALALEGEQSLLAQELFNGIRLAVEEENGAVDLDQLMAAFEGDVEDVAFLRPLEEDRRPVRMMFEETSDANGGVRAAVERLIERGVDVIIGPVYSEDALEAGRVAEQHDTVLIAPMATQDAVSDGRRYVFQANPSVATRGRAMARFAANSLNLKGTGVLAQANSELSTVMAEGFIAEAERQGMHVPFYYSVETASDWADWTDDVKADSLKQVAGEDSDKAFDSVYMPFSGTGVSRDVRHALGALDRAGISVRALGNAEWHDNIPLSEARSFEAVYSNDFWVEDNSPEVRTFVTRYNLLANEAPDRLSFVGYDLVRFLLHVMENGDSGELAEDVRNASRFEGLGMRFDFQGEMINQALFFHSVHLGGVRLLR